jgi:1-aminocyclopropane-1-carboxylate deaminase/D-cysteine desulfhydrase-like pyridoxal-dependent ACC family enzyme
VAGLLKQGFKGLVVEQGAGAQARFSDNDYKAAGAQIVDRATALKQDIVVKVGGGGACLASIAWGIGKLRSSACKVGGGCRGYIVVKVGRSW